MKNKAYTEDEARELFVDHVKELVKDWTTYPNKSVEERVEGVAFSILATLDGEVGDMPGYIVSPFGRTEDKAYHKENGEDYYPVNEKLRKKLIDIAGHLHEDFVRK